MERLSLRTSVLARCWLTMWNVHRNGSCRHDFKVPHALFAPDAGAVRDEFQVIRWDGVNGTLTVGIRIRPCAHP